jgi:hypothetical protein
MARLWKSRCVRLWCEPCSSTRAQTSARSCPPLPSHALTRSPPSQGFRRHALVHKSELCSYRVENVSDAVEKGEAVFVKIIRLEDGKVGRPAVYSIPSLVCFCFLLLLLLRAKMPRLRLSW